MALTKKEVEDIAQLARINLSAEEKVKLAAELGSILNYVDKLDQVNTEGVEPTALVAGLENVLRADNRRPDQFSNRELIIEQLPHKKDNFLKVKSVFKKR